MMMSEIAEDIVKYNILPLLPFKSLCRLMLVSKKWKRVISGDDPMFAKLRPSGFTISPAASIVFLNMHRCIQFLPPLATSPEDVPDPLPISTLFASIDDRAKLYVERIVTATNNMLCLLCYEKIQDRDFSYYICNPLTKEPGHRIPTPSDYDIAMVPVGLVVHKNDDENYVLVYPVAPTAVQYRFNVLSSRHRSRGWTVLEDHVQSVGRPCYDTWGNAVFARGYLHWYAKYSLLWFCGCCCCDKSLATGTTFMPPLLPYLGAHHQVGVCNDMLTCVCFSVEGLGIWMLQDDAADYNKKYWEPMYRASMECMAESMHHTFSHLLHWPMVHRWTRDISLKLMTQWIISPLPFQGGRKVLFAIQVLENDKPVYVLMSFDMGSKEMVEVMRGDLFKNGSGYTFGYTHGIAQSNCPRELILS